MNATTMTIQCTRCSTYLVLPQRLLGKIRGKVGRVPCRGCHAKIRLDARQDTLLLLGARRIDAAELELELEDVPSSRNAHVSLLPGVPSDEPAEEIDAVESVRGPVSTAPPRVSAPPPRRRRASLAPRPPRPSPDGQKSVPPMLPSNPFDELGSLAPVVPLQGVRLTLDGRLINRADEAPAVKPRSRVRTWAPLVVAALLATGLASARVGSILPLPLGRTQAPQNLAGPVQAASLAPAAAPASLATPTLAVAAVLPSEPSTPPSVATPPTSLSPRTAATAPTARRSATDTAAPAAAVTEAQSEAPVARVPGDEAATDEVSTDEDAAASSELPAFSKEAAMVALEHTSADAQACRQAGDPSGIARVIVTFAPSGRVTSATVTGSVYAGTATGGCIASRFRGASVPAFSGSHVTVAKNVTMQ